MKYTQSPHALVAQAKIDLQGTDPARSGTAFRDACYRGQLRQILLLLQLSFVIIALLVLSWGHCQYSRKNICSQNTPEKSFSRLQPSTACSESLSDWGTNEELVMKQVVLLAAGNHGKAQNSVGVREADSNAAMSNDGALKSTFEQLPAQHGQPVDAARGRKSRNEEDKAATLSVDLMDDSHANFLKSAPELEMAMAATVIGAIDPIEMQVIDPEPALGAGDDADGDDDDDD